jgi:hypothetical protein
MSAAPAVWQPIGTAPTETPVLVWCPGARERAEGTFSVLGIDPQIAVAIFNRTQGMWCGDIVRLEARWDSGRPFTFAAPLSPTLWQPMPEPPLPIEADRDK